MISQKAPTDEFKPTFLSCEVVVVGSGAAALNAAVHLKKLGVDEVMLVTERLGSGTSANAGSDKQTYYRLNPVSREDSVRRMAEELFAGGCMHGDIAYVEAALSAREFFHLVEAGVPFPQNRYGGYPGFQTDHDLAGRGTSAGPKTSIMMVEKLLGEARKEGVDIHEKIQVVELLTRDSGKEKSIAGLIALDGNHQPIVIYANYVVYGTGGPGVLYADSVYPHSQLGSLGTALKAGIRAQNLTESQFGIASTGFRWNLSGSYQQVVPCYYSTAADGTDPREFLCEIFPSAEAQFQAQFLKGYQWPFDVRKLHPGGSSLVDLAVHLESGIRGRKVYLDFRRNPSFGSTEFNPAILPPESKSYLENSGAVADTPVGRLRQMNLPAYRLYKENGIDLENQSLEIAVCHQHNNGGLVGSIWWETNITNFFSVGECCGTHGIYRPGGSALNSGQVGSLRAAEMIHYRIDSNRQPLHREASSEIQRQVETHLSAYRLLTQADSKLDIALERSTLQRRMSETLGIFRDPSAIEKAIESNERTQQQRKNSGIKGYYQLADYLKNEDLLITERAFLESNRLLLQKIKKGRGSFLIVDLVRFKEDWVENLNEISGLDLPDSSLNNMIIEYTFDEKGQSRSSLEPVRSLPGEDDWFESVWKDYQENKHFL